MKDEIKEIIEYIQKYTDEYETTNLTEIRALQIGYVDTVLLLDYITNLQEENERLKEENKHIFANVNDDQLLRSNAMNYAELQDYKTRNKKAVEYIEKGNKHFKKNYNEPYEYAFMVNADEIMKILKGKSDE